MNKLFRKAMAVLFAGVMSVSLCTSAAAIDLTINGVGMTSTYNAYRLLDLVTTLKTTGHEGHAAGQHEDSCYTYAYTVNPKYKDLLKYGMNDDTVTDGEIVSYLRDLSDDDLRAFADKIYYRVMESRLDEDIDEIREDSQVKATGSGTVTMTGLPQGYYMISEYRIATAPETDIKSLVMLDTLGQEQITINTKEDIPTLEKKIIEGTDRVDAVDQAVGDIVHYQLKAVVPEEAYLGFVTLDHHYVTKFTDTISKGLALKQDSIVFKIEGTTYALAECDASGKAAGVEVEAGVNVSTAADGVTTLLVYAQPTELADITLDSDAGDITLTVDYDCEVTADAVSGVAGNPNEATLSFCTDPYSTTNHTLRSTPKDKVTVFTYDFIVNKVDGSGMPLKGANFTLQKKNDAGTYEDYRANAFNVSQTTFRFDNLDAGFYRLVETKTPTDYNSIDPVDFEIRAAYDKESDDPELKSLKVFVDGVEQGADSVFTIDLTPGEVKTNVVNAGGHKLPSTGGMGTYAFYIGGGVVVLAGVGFLAFMHKRKNDAID